MIGIHNIYAQKKLPNIIYILADDMGYGDASCYGQDNFLTPNIDKLAKQGMLFTQHYSGSTVCAPSRSALLSGQHTGHTSVRDNARDNQFSEGQLPLSSQTVTIAEVLKKAGYKTGAFGKWGLGFVGTEGDPNNQGFDEFFGYNCQAMAHRYYPTHLWHNDKKVMLDGNDWKSTKTYAADIIHEKALKFIEDNKDQAFFMYYPTTLPHAELIVPNDRIFKRQKKRFKRETPYTGDPNTAGLDYGDNLIIKEYCRQNNPHATFAAMMTRLDKHVGEVVSKLRKLGIEDNTLIIFTSDNGPHKEGGADPDFFDSNGRYRGIKRDLYDGGIRVPMIAKWPNKIKANTVCDHLSAFWDVLPTLAQIANTSCPVQTDGISFLPSLLNQTQPKHEYLYWEFRAQNGRQAIRMGKWKGVRLNMTDNACAPIELYDIVADPNESENLADKYPEVITKMKRLMTEAHIESSRYKFNYENK